MFKNIRFSYWIVSGFLKKHTRLLFFGILIGILSFSFFPKLLNIIPKRKPLEKIAIIGKPSLSEIPLSIQQEISIGLTQISDKGEVIPGLATSFSSEDDGKKYIFNLRDDLIWHDDKPFTSEDVNYNFSDVDVQRPSPSKIIFILKEPFSPFPSIVSQPLFRQKKYGLFKNKITLLGVGDMKVKKITKSGNFLTKIILESQDKVSIYRFYNTQETAITAFKLGEVDKILELSQASELANWPNTKVEKIIHQNRYVALFFNTQDDLLSGKTIRQALTYAISEKLDYEERAISPINPDCWAYNPQVKPYDYNLETSKRLLNDAKEDNPNLNLKIELTTTLPHLDTAEKIKNDWDSLGVETSIKVVSYIPDSFQVILIAQETPNDPDQYSFWHSTQNTNLTKLNSPKIDKLLEDGRQTLDQKERTTIYQDFQRFLVEEIPAAFLYHHQTFTVSRS